jgi:predicted metal-dependent hydrolase
MLRLFERRTPAPSVAHIEVAHGGEIFRVALKRVSTSRRFTLRVRAATRDVLLTMPARGSQKAAREFVERHAAWIGAKLARLPRPIAFAPHARTPLRGVDHTIVHRPGERGVVWTEQGVGGPLICVSGEAPHIARRVADFLKREARKDLESAVARHAERLGVSPRRIVLRDTASRWGSCSSTGGLNFSWRLILAPPFVLDYLAAHEVAHIVHMNHSPMYWKLTRRLFPETERAEFWLKTNGADLHRFGAAEA